MGKKSKKVRNTHFMRFSYSKTMVNELPTDKTFVKTQLGVVAESKFESPVTNKKLVRLKPSHPVKSKPPKVHNGEKRREGTSAPVGSINSSGTTINTSRSDSRAGSNSAL